MTKPMQKMLLCAAVLSTLAVIGGAGLAIYAMLVGLFPFGLLALGSADFTNYPWPRMIGIGMGVMGLGLGIILLISRTMPDDAPRS